MIFNYGQPISEGLSNYLMEFTDKNDVATASVNTGISISTIDYVKRRNNTVTENNKVGIVELMRIAIQNAENNIHRSTQCKKDLSEMLDCL